MTPVNPPSGPATYGADQEAAAQALVGLLRQPMSDYPGEELAQLQLLRSREAALDALVERTALLGVEQAAVAHLIKRGLPVSVERFTRPRGALTWLAATLHASPRLPVELRGSPSDTLATPSPWPAVEASRTAGSLLLSATHWLRVDQAVPWSDDAAGWALLDDIASSTEAVLAWEGQMEDMIASYCGDSRDARTLEAARLGCALAQRVAAARAGRQEDIDNARRPRDLRVEAGRVVVVRTVEDLQVAQHRLAGYLTIRTPRAHVGEARIERNTALAAFQTQLAFTNALAPALAAAGPQWATLGQVADDQAQRLLAARDQLQKIRARHSSAAQVTTVNPVLLQSRELLRGAGLAGEVPQRLTREEIADLLTLSHHVQRHLAERVRSELTRADGTFTINREPTHQPTGLEAPVRLDSVRATKLGKALVAIRDAAPPAAPAIRHNRAQRDLLRALLGSSPALHPEPISPYGPFGPGL